VAKARIRDFCSSVKEFLGDSGRPLVFVLGVSHLSEGVVPVGFQAVGDKAVVGIDGKVATPGQLGPVAGALDVAAAQGVGLVSACFELGLDGERHF
jgi:hypothetical protein